MYTALSIGGLLVAAALLAGLDGGPAAADMKVAATIKPVHSLVAAVMGETGKPALLLDGAASPHVTALRPSQARIVEDSDVVFSIGEGLEAFLHELMENDGATRIEELAHSPGVELLDYREANGHSEKPDEDHAEEEVNGHEHGAIDPHIWLDPVNAAAMVRHIAATLSAADPANADSYRANAEAAARDLDRLQRELAAILAPVKGRAFLVFHDAYQYFEKRFGLNGLGGIVLNPETPPGARRLMEIRRRIGDEHVACVFSEPQFALGYVTTVLEGTSARTASLDYLGVTIEPGPGAYRQILIDLTDTFADCLEER